MQVQTTRFNSDSIIVTIFLIVYLILFSVTAYNPFFWDTIQLGSAHAHYIYETNFSSIILPDHIDSGHPPLLGFLLAVVWMLFGKTLIVSHALIFVFTCLLVVQVVKFTGLITKSLGKKLFLSSLVLLDPTLLSQAALVSPDVILIALLFFSLNHLFLNNRLLSTIGLTMLCLVSMRGMMVCLSLFVFITMYDYRRNAVKQNWFRVLTNRLIVFLPGGILTLIFLFIHFQVKGWIGYHDSSPWAQAFKQGGVTIIGKNLLVFFWRVLDFGRVFIYGILFLTLIYFKIPKQKLYDTDNKRNLLQILVIFFVVTVLPLIIYQGLMAHRYLLPVILIGSIYAGEIIYATSSKFKGKYIILVGVLILLLTGNLWVYPKGIAMGWDSTLAHLPYFQMRENMITFLKQNKIQDKNVGVAFPEEVPRKFLDLSSDTASFTLYDIKRSPYILFCNVYNDFTDADIEQLEKSWIAIKNIKSATVIMTLYKRPDQQ